MTRNNADAYGTRRQRTFESYGVEASSRPLQLTDPPTTTRVVTCGQGPPVVLLHGSGMCATVWAPLLPHLPDRTLHLVELPGCGLAEPFDYTDVDMAAHQTAFVAGVLDALGLERAQLVGASLGGMFALRFALQRPERVRSLALVSAPALALPGARMPRSMAMASGRLGRLLQRLAHPPFARTTRRMLALIGGRRSVEDLPESLFDALGAAMALSAPTNASAAPRLLRGRTPLSGVGVTEEELADCRPPVLLVWGDRDKVQAAAAGARTAETLPDGRIEVLPGGHGIWFDQPSRCGALLTDFLTETERQPAP